MSLNKLVFFLQLLKECFNIQIARVVSGISTSHFGMTGFAGKFIAATIVGQMLFVSVSIGEALFAFALNHGAFREKLN